MAIVASQTFSDIIEDNDWSSVSWKEAEYANVFLKNGIIDTDQPQAQAVINAWDENQENIPDIISLGYVSYPFKEFNIPVIGNTEPVAVDPTFLTLKTKTFYGNQWYGVSTIQRDLLRAADGVSYVNEFLGRIFSIQTNQTVCSTLAGMSDIEEITVGGDDSEFSEELVEKASALKGDAGYKGFSRFYMHSDTLTDIRTKQRSGTIKDVLIAPRKTEQKTAIKIEGSASGTSLGQFVDTSFTGESIMAYLGSTPIYLDDSLKKGVISIVDNGAFAFVQQEFNNPLSYERKAKSNYGVGKEEFGVRYAYIVHPIGFNFKGVLQTGGGAGTYDNIFGLSLAELGAGGQYELGLDIKKCKIFQIKVKIG